MPSIWCALRTFDAHAKEMGGAPLETPRFFLKPWAALTQPVLGSEVKILSHFEEIHHEIELVIELNANMEISQIGIGLDLTDRKTQSVAKSEGMPWAQAKGFVKSAIVGKLSAPPTNLNQLHFELFVNDNMRQSASIAEMCFTPVELISELSKWAPLETGDLLFCGTPSGVGPMVRGDRVQAYLLNEDEICISELDFILI